MLDIFHLIWARQDLTREGVGSIPPWGTWFFFFVQIHYFKLFMYASMTYNHKQESKVLGDLLLITLNFWTVCVSSQSTEPIVHTNPKYICMHKSSDKQYSLYVHTLAPILKEPLVVQEQKIHTLYTSGSRCRRFRI